MMNTITMLDNEINAKGQELNEAFQKMESYILNVSPHRTTIAVKVGTGTLAFTSRKDRWGLYLEAPGDPTRRDFSQMSIAQRLDAFQAFPSLLAKVVEHKQKRLADLNAALDAADAVLASLPRLPVKEAGE